jgi:hypothetical protein
MLKVRRRRQPVRQSSRSPFRPALELLETRLAPSVDVLTQHNDTFRTGLNSHETSLTLQNVNPTTFGKVASVPVDGQVFAQPLVLTGVTVPGQGVHDLVFVATEHDSVYAFDATSGALIWQDSFLGSSGVVMPIPNSDVNGNIGPEIGITSTPVIDPSTGTLYVVAVTKELTPVGGPTYFQRLHALDVATGAEKFGGPTIIAETEFDGTNYTYVSGPSVPGNGDGSVNGMVTFNAMRQMQRPGLLLLNSVVYIAWASYGDHGPYHGWVLGYSASTLQLVSGAVFNVDPNGSDAGVWMSGAGLAADASGNIYFSTGNGTYDVNQGGNDYGDSIVKLSTQSGLSVADYFTPSDQATLNSSDLDLGSGGVMLLPDQPGLHPHLLIQSYKQGTIFVVDRDNMGRFSSANDNVVQELPGELTGVWSMPAYFNGSIYFNGEGDVLKAFSLFNSNVISATPVSSAANAFGYPGATPSISSNGTGNGIVWTLQVDAYGSGGPAVLHAYDARDVSRELYNSAQAGPRDQAGPAVEFTVPTIANGHVYVGTSNSLTIYGLLPTTGLPAGFSHGDVGAVGGPGSASFARGTFTVSGSGADIWGTADTFHYVYHMLQGDGTIIARVTSLVNTSTFAKAGVMIRETMDPGSMNAMMEIFPGGTSYFQWRPTPGGSSNSTQGPTTPAPAWVQLIRTGSVLTGLISVDGANWTTVGSAFIPMSSNVYIGLAVDAGNNSATTTATIDQVTVTTQATYGDQAIDAGGGAAGNFVADTDFTLNSGGTFAVSNAIDTSAVTNPAPQTVYQSERWGNMTYTVTNLSPDQLYRVRLHFAEIFFTSSNQREFSVDINGQQVLTNFDPFSAAGAADKAVIEEYLTQSDSMGRITVQFLIGAANYPKLSGIEVLRADGGGSRLTATGQTFQATAGQTVSPMVASFTDAGKINLAKFTATIRWGDGMSSTGTVQANGSGGYKVMGTHTYARSSLYEITVLLADNQHHFTVVVHGTGYAAPPTAIAVFAAYQDTEHTGGTAPNPWIGSPNVTFWGGTTDGFYDTGAIRIDNLGTQTVMLSPGSYVDEFDNGARFQLWDSFIGTGFSLLPGQSVILAQTGGRDFDTSDQPIIADPTQRTNNQPVIHLIVNGLRETYLDANQILNTGGYDVGNATGGSESLPWQQIQRIG